MPPRSLIAMAAASTTPTTSGQLAPAVSVGTMSPTRTGSPVKLTGAVVGGGGGVAVVTAGGEERGDGDRRGQAAEQALLVHRSLLWFGWVPLDEGVALTEAPT